MAILTGRYLGLELSSPVILSSSSLTGTVNGVQRAAQAGAGAVVLKSLFEEQIDAETTLTEDEADYSIHPEADQYLREMAKQLGPESYLNLIAESKRAVAIPVIASVNCVTGRWWRDYGKQIATTGADALELNIAIMPRGDEAEGATEAAYCRIVEQVRAHVDLPLAVKIGPYFTSLPRLVSGLKRAGADALVLFNRFYQLDIDVDAMELSPGYQYSTPQEIYTPLRWVSILSGDSGCDLAGATGVHTAGDAIKMLLAGAAAVQVCSTVYRNGYETIAGINAGIIEWMDARGYSTIDEFRGRRSQAGSGDPEAYERLQYIRALTGLS